MERANIQGGGKEKVLKSIRFETVWELWLFKSDLHLILPCGSRDADGMSKRDNKGITRFQRSSVE